MKIHSAICKLYLCVQQRIDAIAKDDIITEDHG
jgi:hypothetical protein